jgi:thymidylate synthase
MTRINETTAVWHRMLRDLVREGHEVSPASAGANWKGRTTRDLLGYTSVVPMDAPVITSASRKLFRKFLVGEAAWICSGDNRVSTLAPVAPKRIVEFSDDGVRFFGAYGTKFVEQLSYVTTTLAKDLNSRQAVATIWREQPRSSNDVPCTLVWQYIVRDGKLHCVATMRSSDVWSGWIYDIHNFSMAAAVVALELKRHHGITLGLGNLYLTAGSQHYYKLDEPAIQTILTDESPRSLEYAPLDLAEFATSQELIDHLWALARGDRRSMPG